MGQYYLVTVLGSMYCVHSQTGLKLMEHSYFGDLFILSVESLIRPGGLWYMKQLVWSGDYADPEPEKGKNFWQMKLKQLNPLINPLRKHCRYVLNHDKKLYVDIRKLEKEEISYPIYPIHPLPLLCAEGNGRGGGDFHGSDPNNIVGSWARNRISVQTIRPTNEFKELIFDLRE
jgi:hypothetical protein